MIKSNGKIQVNTRPLPYSRQKGAALFLTLAVLVILTTIVYSLVSRLKVYKQRQRYIICYQAARYAADSAMKYALSKAKDINPKLAMRQDSPDFSNLFYLTYEQQQEVLYEWAELKTIRMLEELENEESPLNNPLAGELPDPEMTSEGEPADPNVPGLYKYDTPFELTADGTIDPNSLTIPGPYGPEWPYVEKPVEFKLGDAKITIKIRDENAKMPLTWGIMNDKDQIRAADEALITFCQWMQMEDEAINSLLEQLEEVKQKKPYSKTLKPIVTLEKITEKVSTPARSSRTSRSSRPSSSSRTSRTIPRTRTVTKKKTRPAAGHTSDFARLLHSSLIDTDTLAVPLPDTGERYESALKYLALWGSQKVNINTAPRHVLEAVFTFGGDQEAIADQIIMQRQVEPFKDIEDFKRRNYRFNDSIDKVKPYIVTKSSFFAIEVTAVCGNAKIVSVATVKVVNGKAETIGIMSN